MVILLCLAYCRLISQDKTSELYEQLSKRLSENNSPNNGNVIIYISGICWLARPI